MYCITAVSLLYRSICHRYNSARIFPGGGYWKETCISVRTPVVSVVFSGRISNPHLTDPAANEGSKPTGTDSCEELQWVFTCTATCRVRLQCCSPCLREESLRVQAVPLASVRRRRCCRIGTWKRTSTLQRGCVKTAPCHSEIFTQHASES